jgi:hypothetical protein
VWYLRSFSTSRFEVEFPYLSDGTPALVVYWGRWADARGGFGPFSKTCVARVEGGVPGGMQLPVYIGKRPALPLTSVSREIEAKAEFMQLPAASFQPEYALPDAALIDAPR